MTSLFLLIVFSLGVIVGSFLNVLTLRYGTGRSIIFDRSKCLSCSHELYFFELIPILSFIFQGGKCRFCGAKISWQYPMVESATGLVFVAVFCKEWPFLFDVFSLPQLLAICYLLFVFSILIAITVYDLRHKIIPDALVWIFAGVSFLWIFVQGQPNMQQLLSGPAIALPFVLIWLFSRGRAMGLGDAKLALGIGWMLGPVFGLSALLISFWLGGFVSVYLLLRSRGEFTMKSEIPFAPFLVLGAFLAYFFQLDLLGITALFNI